MPGWLTGAVPAEGDVPPEVVIARLCMAAILGMAVAATYFLTQRKSRVETAPFVATLVLLTVLLAMVTVVIGNNVARAFGLVGALSIVRFRTVVDDTRDTAFVIFAVVTGMAVGAGLLVGALAGLPVVGLTAWGLSFWGGRVGPPVPATLVVRVGTGPEPGAVVATVLGKYLKETRVTAAATARQGAAIDLTYAAHLKPGLDAISLVAELNRVEGVQSVEWKGPPAAT